ncbi:hypothetical protein J2Z58_003713 [Halobacillus andaensis]|nr:hypothetical protein [Halobacillus andaensis]
MILTYFLCIALFWAGGLLLWKSFYAGKKGGQ